MDPFASFPPCRVCDLDRQLQRSFPGRCPTDRVSAQPPSGPLQKFSNQIDRPIEGDCTTTFTFIDPGAAGQCAVFQPVPSAFIAISGVCTVSHLGRTELSAVQQLVFLLDANGQPVFIRGSRL